MTELKPIGKLHTPYKDQKPPRQAIYATEGEFMIELFPEYVEGLMRLEEHEYIIVLYHADRPVRDVSLTVAAHTPDGKARGLFASRSPVRPNPINLCVVKLNRIEGPFLHTSGLDALDGSPLLDIKPYVPKLDRRP